MRRYYGGLLFSFFLDAVLIGVFFLLVYRIEPMLSRRRREAWTAKRETAAAGGEDGFELLAGEHDASKLSEDLLSESKRAALTTASSKSILDHGFRLCNQGIRLDLDFRNMTLTLPAPQNKTILSDVSGRIRPGRVTAIMGPSGAGKTTFLNVLVGKLPRTNGALRINGALDEMYRYKKVR
jgi:ABC-type multidrug transport system fused ATPase/permease subunit